MAEEGLAEDSGRVRESSPSVRLAIIVDSESANIVAETEYVDNGNGSSHPVVP